MAALKKIEAPVTLTVSQSSVLGMAACRADGAAALPGKVKGQAAERPVAALLQKGLVREIRAKPEMPVWRREVETGRSYALVITKLGRASVAAAQGGITQPPAEQDAAAGKPVIVPDAPPPVIDLGSSMLDGQDGPRAETSVAALQPAAEVAAAVSVALRAGSKLAEVMALLGRDTGASVEELMAATGWLPHTTRAALTGLRKRGFTILREHRDGKGSVHRTEQQPRSCAEAA